MSELVDDLLDEWESKDSAITLACDALWGINSIHPFVNGNGRTARAVCYFILCVKLGGTLPGGGITILETLRNPPVRQEYVNALESADSGDLQPLIDLVSRLLTYQLTLDDS